MTVANEEREQMSDTKPCTCPLGDCLPACSYCRDVSIDEPCPHDFAETLVPTIEGLMDDLAVLGWDPVVVCVDGSEPFASLGLGDGFVLDLTAQVREVRS